MLVAPLKCLARRGARTDRAAFAAVPGGANWRWRRAHGFLGRVNRQTRLFLVALAALVVASACSRPLPEAGTPQAELYRKRCGACHRPFHPGSMTAAMWKYQVERAEKSRMMTAGQKLSEEEYRQILDYLVRNAGKS
ncbi:MAG: hypothetical protein D6815_05970 [Candidatus Dadabacteria bacterium]|nr:MAG: hypothetical protein D6815_05970 [Candidatus Dadabacteria bacterium]